MCGARAGDEYLHEGVTDRMSWQAVVEETVKGLDYELVECERAAGGLLRVFIEHPDVTRSITVDDCERVTRQLQYALEVDGADYRRLEVSSPGLDRLLRNAADFDRFIGELVTITFKLPVGMPAEPGQKPAGAPRKRFTGRLQVAEPGQDGWLLVLEALPQRDTRRNKQASAARKSEAESAEAVAFVLDEVREARLVPEVDFKGRRSPASVPENESTLNKNGDRDK